MPDGPYLPVADENTEDLELLPMTTEEVLDTFHLSVPDTQRGYRWRGKNVLDLLLDTWQHFTRTPARRYMLGTLRLAKDASGRRVLFIYDGQHRTITLVVVLRCFYEYLHGITTRTKDETRLLRTCRVLLRTEVKDGLPGEVVEVQEGEDAALYLPRVRHYQTSVDALLCAMQAHLNTAVPEPTGHAAADLYRAYQTVTKWIRAHSRADGGREHLTAWLTLLLGSTQMAVEVSPDLLSGETAFRQANDRSVPLSEGEQLRAYLLGALPAGSEERTKAAEEWDELEYEVRSVSGGMGKFLKAYPATQLGAFRADALEVLASDERLADAADTVHQMRHAAQAYVRIAAGCRPQDNQPCGALHDIISVLGVTGAENFRTVLLAARGCDAEAFDALARGLQSYLVVHNVLETTRDTRQTHLLPLLQSASTVRSASDAQVLVADLMRAHVSPCQADFLRKLEVTVLKETGYRTRLFLGLAEERLCGLRNAQHTRADSVTRRYGREDNAHIEHILARSLPQRVVAAYGTTEEAARNDMGLLGNLTLLDGNTNSSLGNKTFDTKKGEYAKSSYQVTRATVTDAKGQTKDDAALSRLTTCTAWTQTDCVRRGSEMAALVWEETVARCSPGAEAAGENDDSSAASGEHPVAGGPTEESPVVAVAAAGGSGIFSNICTARELVAWDPTTSAHPRARGAG